MDKVMWAGRFSEGPSKLLNDFNSSIKVDKKMYREDIEGSIAHATMLGAAGIIDQSDADLICEELKKISEEIAAGELIIDENAEDIHTFIEQTLTARIGDAGKKVHTARSRNDQVATDVRLNLHKKTGTVVQKIADFISVIVDKAEQNKDVIMPGYTHLQRAQPVTFAHHILAYAEALYRDLGRFCDADERMMANPLGSCALAGTTHKIDRAKTTRLLGFDEPCRNSIDGVSDRDFCLELAAASSICMTHLSRFAEEIILWCSWEFKFIELSDAFSTGSSIMPQKKNPDVAELIRGKTGRVNGDLIALLTVFKGLPLAYNKDMQEDKEAIFDSMDTLIQCLEIFAPMLDTAKINTDRMLSACADGFINATDCADYLVKKGVPFRTAYKISGQIVAYCIENNKTLEKMSIDEYKKFSDVFQEDVFKAVDMAECVKNRNSFGGPAFERTEEEIAFFKKQDFYKNKH